MPVCARCAGLYVALAAALPVYIARSKQRAGAPGRVFVAASIVAMLVFLADGAANFELIALVNTPDYLRLATGALAGFFLAPYIALLFAKTLDDADDAPMAGRMDAIVLVLATAALTAMNLHPAKWLIEAESYLAAAGLVLFLGVAHMALLMLVVRRRVAIAASIAVFTVSAQIVMLAEMRKLIGL